MIKIKNYLSLIKFSHTIFAMPFALIGFSIAAKERMMGLVQTGDTKPLWQTFIYVILCMIFARSAAMAFNRYLDRHFDEKNIRTAVREIPKGVIAPKQALIFTVISCILFMASCWSINLICFLLSPVALFVVLFYSYTKRFTALCHLVLGLGLSLAPIGAYLAVTGKFAVLPVLFSLAVLFWVSGFDIIYALQDEEFDKQYQLHSIPAFLGKTRALSVSEFLHILSAACVFCAAIGGHFQWFYWTGFCVFSGMLFYQHSIVKPNDLRRVNIAFMTANGIASVIFALFVLLDIFLFNNPHI